VYRYSSQQFFAWSDAIPVATRL